MCGLDGAFLVGLADVILLNVVSDVPQLVMQT